MIHFLKDVKEKDIIISHSLCGLSFLEIENFTNDHELVTCVFCVNQLEMLGLSLKPIYCNLCNKHYKNSNKFFSHMKKYHF